MDIQRYQWLSMESLGSLWGHFDGSFGHFGASVGSLWGHSGVSFPFWGHFAITLGSLPGQFGINLRLIWEQFWDPSGHTGAISQMIPTGFGLGYSQFGIP